MRVLILIKEFWLDFFIAYYNRLMKNAKYETPISILIHLSFIQAVNFNTILVAFLKLFFVVKLNFVILFSPIVVFALINSYCFYIKLDAIERANIFNRKPKYKRIVYNLYDIISTILFVIVLYIYSL